ncbi:MAG: hypothetical protein PQJ47_07730 [Sphaerochaetaceae bacterium]|nr:hypothetical protein [Sphaerochaetaceae bacterium]
MSISNPKQEEFDRSMRNLCNELDEYLENRFGSLYDLHPNRLKRGKAGNVSYDGLFSTGTKFTLGYGSPSGKGYLVDIEIVTLEKVSHQQREIIEMCASDFLEEKLPLYFPSRELHVIREGRVYKIVGDFSLGTMH